MVVALSLVALAKQLQTSHSTLEKHFECLRAVEEYWLNTGGVMIGLAGSAEGVGGNEIQLFLFC